MTERDLGEHEGYLKGLQDAIKATAGLKDQMPLARAERFADVLTTRLKSRIDALQLGSDLLRSTSTHLGG